MFATVLSVFASVFLAAEGLANHISNESMVHQIHFLPDDAQIACRAILPQCFKRSDWAKLCAADPNIALSHPDACRAAEF